MRSAPWRQVCFIALVLTVHCCCRCLRHTPLKTGFSELDEVLGGQGLVYPAALDLVGHSGSGKTEFMLNFCATNILPENFHGVPLGGAKLVFQYHHPNVSQL